MIMMTTITQVFDFVTNDRISPKRGQIGTEFTLADLMIWKNMLNALRQVGMRPQEFGKRFCKYVEENLHFVRRTHRKEKGTHREIYQIIA